jgi:hypothetical protein
MASFTEDMFNRIIAFQEKQHPAWNTALPFHQRLEGLPLHYLLFSNPDRDPAKFGPTVAHYYPLAEEMVKISRYLKTLSDHPVVCDQFPGNGFIGSLLANEGINVIGLQKNIPKPNQIKSFYDTTCYRFSDTSLDKIECDGVFTSWPPSGINPTSEILLCDPKIIVYIYTNHVEPGTQNRQTGTDNMFDEINARYRLLDSWSVTKPKDLLFEIWPDMTRNIEETRHTRIYLRTDHEPMDKISSVSSFKLYDWEKDLRMAQLALEAKLELFLQGYRV